MIVTHYHVSEPIDGVCKQSAIWVRGKNTASSPLVFLQRPKWITNDEAWLKIVKSIELKLPRNFKLEE